ncbi:conserved hypothetical protein, membrane [Candidatus Thiomargarita nelsonii]|uniref:Glycerophosphoryl diester phosphodiesterase membrane domain-containing protein n=1 Tax=Candidatus Thiomargarita nelsonii TaxID=1003181 RepID=A0A176S0X8_9GAMM|nr:conserved hypothetical protein, membrane [Candidatus Thiomargarita nelsonii]
MYLALTKDVAIGYIYLLICLHTFSIHKEQINMTTDNPYKPPATEIHDNLGASETGGTFQDGIDGNYDFLIMDVIKEAWEKTYGVKVTLLGAFLVYWLVLLPVTFGLDFVFATIMGFPGFDSNSIVVIILISLIQQSILAAILYPFIAGIMMVGVRRSVDLPVSLSMVFGYLVYTIPVAIAAILMTILTMIGFFLLIIPGLYLSVAYLLTIPLIVEKNLGSWQAMEASRKAITHHWFKVFFTYFVMSIIMMISAIPLGIGLIWTLPMMVNVGGILYRIMFGVEEAR